VLDNSLEEVICQICRKTTVRGANCTNRKRSVDLNDLYRNEVKTLRLWQYDL